MHALWLSLAGVLDEFATTVGVLPDPLFVRPLGPGGTSVASVVRESLVHVHAIERAAKGQAATGGLHAFPRENDGDRLAAVDALREAAWRVLCLHGMPLDRQVATSGPLATRVVGPASLGHQLASVVGLLQERLAAIGAVLGRPGPVAVSA